MEKISWTDHVRNEEVLLRVEEQRNILREISKWKANWIGHILRRNEMEIILYSIHLFSISQLVVELVALVFNTSPVICFIFVRILVHIMLISKEANLISVWL